ncbi:MAG: hypothetical protein ACRD1G_15710, partial [Acidimicrobiales bacterium]
MGVATVAVGAASGGGAPTAGGEDGLWAAAGSRVGEPGPGTVWDVAEDAEGTDPEALRHAVEELRKENEELRSARGADGGTRRGSIWKRISSWVLIVLACILAVLSIFVVFARNELLNTDAYVNTVAPLAGDPAIQAAVAHQVSKRLIAQTDVQKRVEQALPDRAGFLATPISNGLRNATEQITLKVVQSPQFETLW